MFKITCLQMDRSGRVRRFDIPTVEFVDKDQADRAVARLNETAEPGMEYHVFKA